MHNMVLERKIIPINFGSFSDKFWQRSKLKQTFPEVHSLRKSWKLTAYQNKLPPETETEQIFKELSRKDIQQLSVQILFSWNTFCLCANVNGCPLLKFLF